MLIAVLGALDAPSDGAVQPPLSIRNGTRLGHLHSAGVPLWYA